MKSSALKLNSFSNKIYLNRFLKRLKKKIEDKKHLLSENMYCQAMLSQNFFEFDNAYTAPIHGFLNAEEYWNKCSSVHFIENITRKALIINALNDPFLDDACFPFSETKKNKNTILLTPKHGGHVGFPQLKRGANWIEKISLDFFEN